MSKLRLRGKSDLRPSSKLGVGMCLRDLRVDRRPQDEKAETRGLVWWGWGTGQRGMYEASGPSQW